MPRIDIRQLKAMRRYPVPADVLLRGRVRIVSAVEAAPMLRRGWFVVGAWKPAMALMMVVLMASSGATFAAAHGALPGERLYAVKMVGEAFRERLAFTPEQRYVIQAAHAARRLQETERILVRDELITMERVERVRSAMDRYEDHLFLMNEIAVRLDGPEAKPTHGARALLATEKMMERQASLLESATRAEPALASLVVEPVDASITLEDELWGSIPSDDGSRGEADERRQERNRKIERALHRLRDDEDRGLDGRDEEARRGNALEIGLDL